MAVPNGKLVAICVASTAGAPMQLVEEVNAIAGSGLEGDRYASGNGSFNKGQQGKGQVTLINAKFFLGSGFEFIHSRRNLVVEGVELMRCIGKEFLVGGVRMRGVKYCEPCNRPSNLTGNQRSFQDTFFDGGGLVAEILEGGPLRTGDPVVAPPKNY